ncbi:MAG: hypothetical protein P8O07_06085, partial [Crocinitomicaceae bacterium]|nr:hypothetical protein [Crocinitomicaceae bacterium]
ENSVASNDTDIQTQKINILNKVDQNYADEINQLNSQLKDGTATQNDVLERNSGYLENLNTALNAVNQNIEKNGETTELTNEKNILQQEINAIEAKVAELNQLIAEQENNVAANTTFTPEQREEVINKTDHTYSFDIGELEQQLQNKTIGEEMVIGRKEQYKTNIERALDRINAEINNKGISTERLLEQSILTSELNSVSLDIEQISLQLAQAKEDHLSDITKKTALTTSEKAAINSTQKDLSLLTAKLTALDKLALEIQELIAIETNQGELIRLRQALAEVQKRKRQVRFDIGDVEQTNIIAQLPENVASSKTEKQIQAVESNQVKITELNNNKVELESRLNATDSETEKAKIEAQIDKTEEKIAREQVEILSTTTDVSAEVISTELSSLSPEEQNSVSTLEAEQLNLSAQRLIEQAESEKDPQLKSQYLAQAQDKQNQALEAIAQTKNSAQKDAIIGEIIAAENIELQDDLKFFQSRTYLEKEQQSIDVQLLAIQDELKEIDLSLRTAKKKEVQQLEIRKNKLVALQRELTAKRNDTSDELAILKQKKQSNLGKGIDEKSIDYNLTYKEEVEIAQSDNYKALFPVINKLEQKQYELQVKEQLIFTNTQIVNDILDNNPTPIEEEKAEVSYLLQSVAYTQKEIETIRLEIKEQQALINQLLPSDPRDREITQNLLARNVTPVMEAPSLPVMATGLIIADKGSNVYNDANPIPLEVAKPKGLFFRVQIGAFSKPVPNETFNDFSPVSGEQVRPGLIRYMAGYFGGRRDAENARDRIREMGYSDAFAVAYCDGERIPVYRAVQLMESGACVPTITSSETPILVASETSEMNQLGGFEPELDEFAYNKAPGAAEAMAGETKLGLYFTVQVGVYNRPVPASQLKNIFPLITLRLPNGQMRYSSGMFDNVPQASIKRKEAIDLGIQDAYIVAYYKGERISVAQANKLLAEHGNSILESVTPTERNKNTLSTVINAPKPPEEPVLKGRSLYSQFKSKATYESYPTQVLNRFNEDGGLFYYDENTGKIQSILYPLKNTPSLPLLRSELDEIAFYQVFEVKDLEATSLSAALNQSNEVVNLLTVKVTFEDLTDDLMNVFIAENCLKQIFTSEAGLIMQFFEFETADQLVSLEIEMARLGATELVLSNFTCDLND